MERENKIEEQREEIIPLFNILTREINRFMQEEVMQRRGEELSKLKTKEDGK